MAVFGTVDGCVVVAVAVPARRRWQCARSCQDATAAGWLYLARWAGVWSWHLWPYLHGGAGNVLGAGAGTLLVAGWLYLARWAGVWSWHLWPYLHGGAGRGGHGGQTWSVPGAGAAGAGLWYVGAVESRCGICIVTLVRTIDAADAPLNSQRPDGARSLGRCSSSRWAAGRRRRSWTLAGAGWLYFARCAAEDRGTHPHLHGAMLALFIGVSTA